MAMAGLDIAGVVGTWVAAGLAVIALFGIVGPILILRASRTERHKAIVGIGSRNHGYVSKGIPVWPGVRLAQRVRAPRIDMARKFKDKEWIEFDSRRMKLDDSKVSESPASWVSFGAFLEGYAVEFEADSDIAVSSSSAFLPVSKAFLMTFALVGRFSDEPDRRRKIKGDGARTWDRRNARKYPQYDFEVGVRHGHRLFTEIHGLTGTLSFKMPDEDSHEPVAGDIVKSSWSVVFDGESILEPLQIPSNPISLEDMTMLCLGFLPFCGDNYINFLDPLEDDYSKGEDRDIDDTNQVGKGYTRYTRLISNTRVRDVDGNYDDLHGYVRPMYRERTPRRFKSIIDPNDPPITVIAYQLWDIILVEAKILAHLPRQENAKYFALLEMGLDGKTQSELRKLSDHTFVPAAAPWVRLDVPSYAQSDSSTEYYIRRVDAQRIALSLLNIPWHPEGYLLPGVAKKHSRAKVMQRLGSISGRTRPFLIRLRQGISALNLSSKDEQSFLKSSELVVKRAASSPTRRSLLEPLFLFDEIVKDLQHERVEVQQMVGILMLTNEEFADLVYQSARHMTVSSKVPIEFDFRAGTLTIPSTFGTVQTFELDVENLQRQQQLQLGAQGKISVEHSDILKAALRAYLRSLMLASCYDAEPLTDCFDSITGDILYMA
jgi:hypothetical protein